MADSLRPLRRAAIQLALRQATEATAVPPIGLQRSPGPALVDGIFRMAAERSGWQPIRIVHGHSSSIVNLMFCAAPQGYDL